MKKFIPPELFFSVSFRLFSVLSDSNPSIISNVCKN